MSNHVKPVIQAQVAEVAINDYLIVKPGTEANEVDIAIADDKGYGIAQVSTQLNAIVAGETIEVAVMGGAFVKLGATVEKGDSLMPTTAGKAIKATTGKWAVAVADEGGVVNDVIACRIFIHQLD